MPATGFNSLLRLPDVADGVQILNSSTETIMAPNFSFNAYDPLLRPGAAFRVSCFFDVSFVITTPGTLTFRLRWGGVSGTVLAASGAYAPDPTAAVTTKSGWLEFVTVWRTVSPAASSSSAFTMGRLQLNDVDDASATTLKGNAEMGVIPVSAPAVVTSLDTTTAKDLAVTAQFSVTTATTQLTNHIRLIEDLAPA
jgi:hypothetical protein